MKDALVGRQPIFDSELRVVAYELLYRSDQPTGPGGLDGDQATSEVILNTFMGIGLERLVGSRRAFINFTAKLLQNDDPFPLFHQRVVLEILEDIEVDDELINAVKALVRQGYTVALDDFSYHPSWEPLIDLAEIIKVDVLAMDIAETRALVERLKGRNVKLLAEKVETLEEYQAYRDMGFHYFQGYFFSKPTIVRGQVMAGDRLSILRLLARLQDPAAEVEEIEQIISADVAMSYKLLRYINSASFSLQQAVESIRWAVVFVGLGVVRRLASIVAMARIEDKPNELMNVAFTRAQMCLLLAQKARLPDADKYFVVGLFSTLDALLDTPMEEIVSKLPLSDEINDALLNRWGPMGQALACAQAYEQCRWSAVVFRNMDTETITEIFATASAASFSAMSELMAD